MNTRTFVRFRLAGCSYQAKASGVALVTPYEKDFTPAADGSISGTLYRNDTEISCLDQLDTTWYEVTVYRDGKPQKPTPYRVAAATFNLNTAAPMTTTNVPAARDAVVVNPTALQTINTHPLAFGAGSGLSATYQGSVQSSGTYLRSNGTTFAPAAPGTVNDDLLTPTNQNGVLYWPNAGSTGLFATTPTSGAGTLCLVSTDGGTPAFSSCAGSTSTAWSALSAPSSSLTLAMGTHTTQFNWSGNTGGSNLFAFQDDLNNTGTGNIVDIRSNSNSTASPFIVRVRQAAVLQSLENGAGNGGITRIGNFPTSGPLTVRISSGSPQNTELWKTVRSDTGGSSLDGEIATTTDVTGEFLGICVKDCGGVGGMDIAIAGYTQCVFDNATTAGNWVTMSTTANGQCHDAGAAFPVAALNGQTVIGRAAQTAAAGTRGIFLMRQELQPDSSRLTTTAFLSGALTSTWTGATFTVPANIRLIRLQAQAKTAPSGCSTNAIVRFGDNGQQSGFND